MYIKSNFPGFRFEKGFAEKDPCWMRLKAEPRANQDARSQSVLDDIFANDDSTYISISSHSGEIASLLRVYESMYLSSPWPSCFQSWYWLCHSRPSQSNDDRTWG